MSTATVPMVPTRINGSWTLLLPEYRAKRTEWVSWEPERLCSMSAYLTHGMSVFDIGSEEGDISALVASWVAPGAVVLVEPNPKVWPSCRAVWEANHLQLPLGTFHGFAGPIDRYDPGAWRDWWTSPTIWPDAADGQLIGAHGFLNLCEEPEAPVIKVDMLANLARRAPDAITIDVEGSELEVLRGARATLAVLKPAVFVSIHPEMMSDLYGQDPDDLHRFMASVGYIGTHLGTDHEQHWRFEPEQ